MCRLAQWLRVPVVVTEEEPELNGETASPVKDALSSDTARHVKPVFDLAACSAILADVTRHERGTVVLCGLETDVCVAGRPWAGAAKAAAAKTGSPADYVSRSSPGKMLKKRRNH